MKSVNATLDLLKVNYELGDKIPKRQWPRFYVQQLGLNSLFRCDLAGGWRLTYTLSYNGAGIRVDVIEVMTHREYDKRFAY